MKIARFSFVDSIFHLLKNSPSPGHPGHEHPRSTDAGAGSPQQNLIPHVFTPEQQQFMNTAPFSSPQTPQGSTRGTNMFGQQEPHTSVVSLRGSSIQRCLSFVGGIVYVHTRVGQQGAHTGVVSLGGSNIQRCLLQQ